MKRRAAIRSLLTVPAAAALPNLLSAQPAARLPGSPHADETPNTPTVAADSLAATVVKTFDIDQFSALTKLSSILAPSQPDVPGARDAKVAEFLDFLIGQSPAERITLYKQGLDSLNEKAREQTGKPFAELTAEQTAPILSPLRDTWTYEPPKDAFAQFLLSAKKDVLKATHNSREYITAASRRDRGADGIGVYWYPIFD